MQNNIAKNVTITTITAGATLINHSAFNVPELQSCINVRKALIIADTTKQSTESRFLTYAFLFISSAAVFLFTYWLDLIINPKAIASNTTIKSYTKGTMYKISVTFMYAS